MVNITLAENIGTAKESKHFALIHLNRVLSSDWYLLLLCVCRYLSPLYWQPTCLSHFSLLPKGRKKKKTPSLSNIINTLLPREILHLNLWAIYIAYDPAMWRNTSCLMSMNKPTTLHIKLPLIFPTPNLQSLCTYIGKGSKSERL